MNKEEVLQIITRQVESNINEISNSLEDYKDASNIDEGDTVDPEDYSQQAEKREMQYQMQIRLDNAKAGLIRLKEFSSKQFSTASSGALLETDKNWFLLGISIPSLHLGNKELLGISPESPAFSIINGKSAGDSFELGKNTYTILRIY